MFAKGSSEPEAVDALLAVAPVSLVPVPGLWFEQVGPVKA